MRRLLCERATVYRESGLSCWRRLWGLALRPVTRASGRHDRLKAQRQHTHAGDGSPIAVRAVGVWPGSVRRPRRRRGVAGNRRVPR